jgi:UDP-sulfoquinovose synthase
METFTVNELAALTKESAFELGYDVVINHIENPREEQEEHYYNPVYKGLTDLGVKPHLLSKQSMIDMIKTVEKFKEGINKSAIFNGMKW